MPLNAKVISPCDGIVVSNGWSTNGGNYIYILGANLRTYYFAHLNKILVSNFQLVKASDVIGLVGDTGNAKDKPFHLHFSVCSLIPIFHYWNFKNEGWKKMFYLNPVNQFKTVAAK
jgi:murein DD-endopeptidase MepM/ murein hydrolase activator NlpD